MDPRSKELRSLWRHGGLSHKRQVGFEALRLRFADLARKVAPRVKDQSPSA